MSKLLTQNPLWLLSAIILASAFLVSSGFFLIDEAIYYLGARAFAEHGSLAVDNGYAQFHAESLKLRFLVDGPHGLTPQYPAGSALLGGLLLPLLGPRAFILMNALAGIAMLFTIRRICIDQFKSEAIALIAIALLVAGSFWLEFAVGIWPHMVAAYFALQALWLALRHLDSKGQHALLAVLSGLFAGVGILFRLDAAFVIPAIGLILLMFAPRYVRSSIWFGVGVLPSIALMSVLNMAKFGTPNPFSYGQAGGNTDITAYGAAFAALCVGVGALMFWRRVGRKVDLKVAFATLVLIGGALLFIPATNGWLLRFWNGFLALVLDFRDIEYEHFGVKRGPGNTIVAWGQVKKSLGQSMPWIGLAALLLTSRVQKADRRIFAILFTFIAIITMPYILLSWPGGGGSNMRYFLPVLPALCIVCAKILTDLCPLIPRVKAFAFAGAIVALGLGFAWTVTMPSQFVGVQQILSTYVFLATVMTALGAGFDWRMRQISNQMAIAMVSAGFVMSMIFAVSDFGRAAQRRASNFEGRLALAGLPANSLIIAYPDWIGERIPGNGSILSIRDEFTRQVDPHLIEKALAARKRVFLVSFEFNKTHDVPPGLQAVATDHKFTGGRMVELLRVVGRERHSGPIPPPSAELSNP